MNIEYEWLILFLLISALFILLYYLQNKKMLKSLDNLYKQDSMHILPQWLGEMRASMDRNTDFMNRQFSNANDALNQRLDSTSQLLRLLNQDLAQVHQVGQQMRDFQHFFRSPQIRGKLGEEIMEEILFQVLPRSAVSTQHRFQTGLVADAVIKLQNGSIPIDAKFPLENYQKAKNAPKNELALSYMKEFKRDVKRHVHTISSKYIVPEEGTLDFAIMYIPSDTLYYEIISDDNLLKQAERENVLCVSPNSFYYFLRLILAGLYSSKIEKTAAIVMQRISAFEKNITELSNELNTLLVHINNSKNAGDRVAHRVQILEKKLEELLHYDQEQSNT